MSDRVTEVRVKGRGSVQLNGRVSRDAAIAQAKRHWVAQLLEAQEMVSGLEDEENVVVSTFLGPWARKNEEIVT